MRGPHNGANDRKIMFSYIYFGSSSIAIFHNLHWGSFPFLLNLRTNVLFLYHQWLWRCIAKVRMSITVSVDAINTHQNGHTIAIQRQCSRPVAPLSNDHFFWFIANVSPCYFFPKSEIIYWAHILWQITEPNVKANVFCIEYKHILPFYCKFLIFDFSK